MYKIEKELRDLGSERTPNYEKVFERDMIAPLSFCPSSSPFRILSNIDLSPQRTCLYKVLAALALECPREVLHLYYQNFLGPVVRDIEGNSNPNKGEFP